MRREDRRKPTSRRLRHSLPAALVLLAAQAAFAAPVQAPPNAISGEFQGRCDYSEKLAELTGQGYSFALCDSVAIKRKGAGATIDFRRTSWGSSFRYEGEMTGDTMKVASVSVRSGKPVPVTGECQIRYRGGLLDVVTCIAKDRRQTYLANFVLSRINPAR